MHFWRGNNSLEITLQGFTDWWICCFLFRFFFEHNWCLQFGVIGVICHISFFVSRYMICMWGYTPPQFLLKPSQSMGDPHVSQWFYGSCFFFKLFFVSKQNMPNLELGSVSPCLHLRFSPDIHGSSAASTSHDSSFEGPTGYLLAALQVMKTGHLI